MAIMIIWFFIYRDKYNSFDKKDRRYNNNKTRSSKKRSLERTCQIETNMLTQYRFSVCMDKYK
ncbi:hypothetical protein HanIR_Chr02g0059301 [Helianthus annuus]|nr:hypothetical protein HanIR_Chr02g0059301 [Helianthus annuus]